MSNVNVEVKNITIPTYAVHDPELNPFFLEKRVFQGSSGRTYPLPFYNRVSNKKSDQQWQAVYIENDYIEVVILPQIGGRIFSAKDKSNGYDFIYRQDVIKPALVGLAGPWISGGIEFNWPQHHRPATYMKAEFEVEEHDDGSATVWLSDHDPLQRMKGMHGVCLHPDKSYIELKVRAYNRTEYTQTFLWWANIATRVHEQYQSFFPADVKMVADHAKRALSTFPHCSDKYYGVDYHKRAEEGVPAGEIPAKFIPPHCREKKEGEVGYSADDLSWYANIPVPTSYMCIGSEGDFCGGYDHAARAGTVHVANHHISPGKKQWTWGNHDFGYEWDKNLSDSQEPYIELMAGVYTDNQPDFSYLLPGETKTWSQYFYPISRIGTASKADRNFALNMEVSDDSIIIGVAATGSHQKLNITVESAGEVLYRAEAAVSPENPFTDKVAKPARIDSRKLLLRVTAENGATLTFCNAENSDEEFSPETATEPLTPEDIQSNDELYITGLHLEQYRHATRDPEIYWQEALRRDPDDSRCNNALGLRCFHRGEFTQAEEYFRTAIRRLTRRNPNPADGEAFYNLGLTLRLSGNNKEAYAALYKATWNMAWRASAYHALAEIDAQNSDWEQALEHLDYSLRYNTDNLRARNLKTMILRELSRTAEADSLLLETQKLDSLDIWSRYLAGKPCLADSQAIIDFAIDLQRAGFYRQAIELLYSTTAERLSGTAPMLLYIAAWIAQKQGDAPAAAELRQQAESCSMDYCFPSRLEELLALQAALSQNPDYSRAAYYLGNLHYNNRRHEEAVELWLQSVRVDPRNAIAWRNIGLGAYNSRNDSQLAVEAYNKAVELNPADPRLIYERDLLFKRIGLHPEKRLEILQQFPELIAQRDELLIEYCTLLNQLGRPQETAERLYTHKFQPWEGGEGMALGLHVRLNLLLGQQYLSRGDTENAVSCFRKALTSPENLGEAKHLLANQSDIHYWLGLACSQAGDNAEAEKHWRIAAETRGDFQTMEVREFSEMTYYSALAMRSLGQNDKAAELLGSLGKYADDLLTQKAKIDYFATSLPNLLLFAEDIDASQQIRAEFMKAQSLYGMGDTAAARDLCRKITEKDPSHSLAADFLIMIEQSQKNI